MGHRVRDQARHVELCDERIIDLEENAPAR
jgi:hypothetical protein